MDYFSLRIGIRLNKSYACAISVLNFFEGLICFHYFFNKIVFTKCNVDLKEISRLKSSYITLDGRLNLNIHLLHTVVHTLIIHVKSVKVADLLLEKIT